MNEDINRRALRAALDERVIEVLFKPSNYKLCLVKSRDRKALYLIYPDRYCSCTSFLFNLYKKGKGKCYHLKAYEIAIKKNLIKIIEEKDENFEKYFVKILMGILR